MPDNGITLQEEIVMIRVFDKLIPETCCGVIENDKLFFLLGIVPVVNNNCMKLNQSIIFIKLREKVGCST